MANEMVKFKKGLHASLPKTAANIEVGTFYLTTDTDRLYVGQLKDNVATLVELNKSPSKEFWYIFIFFEYDEDLTFNLKRISLDNVGITKEI